MELIKASEAKELADSYPTKLAVIYRDIKAKAAAGEYHLYVDVTNLGNFNSQLKELGDNGFKVLAYTMEHHKKYPQYKYIGGFGIIINWE